jgi:hypothetical protein
MDELTTLRREVVRLKLKAGEAPPGSIWQLRRNLAFEGWVEQYRTLANFHMHHPDHPEWGRVPCPTDEGMEEDTAGRSPWLIYGWKQYAYFGDIFRRYCTVCARPFDMDEMDHFLGADDLPHEDYYECRDRDNCTPWITNTDLGRSWMRAEHEAWREGR